MEANPLLRRASVSDDLRTLRLGTTRRFGLGASRPGIHGGGVGRSCVPSFPPSIRGERYRAVYEGYRGVVMNLSLPDLIFLAGIGQLTILIASSLVPFRLKWREELRGLPVLHRQMYWVYGGYVVLSILALGILSICNSGELASGSRLARGVCMYTTVFWAIRLALQAVFDVKQYLNTWWTKAGYFALTLMFAGLTAIYSWAALGRI